MDKFTLFWSKTNRWHRLILLFIVIYKFLPSGQLGFRCNDPALSHPFTGDTISWKWLLGTVAFIPLVVMLIVERNINTGSKREQSKRQAVTWYKEYLFGTLLNLTVVHLLKTLVGAPRPHFFDTCNPEEAVTCQGSEFVPSYTCSKVYWLTESDMSFPSGHTSLSLHAGLFIAYYLHQRTAKSSRVTLATQAASVLCAVLCSVSRLADRRHHWWDVMAGAAIAAPILVYTVHTLCGNFQCRRQCDSENENDGNTEISDINNIIAGNTAT